MGEQVLDIQDTTDIINRALIDGDTRIVVLNDTLQHIRECRTEVKIDHILATGHHFLSRLVAEADDAFKHILLLTQLILVSQFKCLLQIVYTQHMVLFLHHLLGQDTGTDKH